MTTPCEKIGSKSCGWVSSGTDATTEIDSRRLKIHPGKRRVFPVKLARADHPCLQTALIPKPEQLLAEENRVRRWGLGHRPQPTVNRRHPQRCWHLPGTSQPRRLASGGVNLRGAWLSGFQVGMTLAHRSPTRQVQESVPRPTPPGAPVGGEGMLPVEMLRDLPSVNACRHFVHKTHPRPDRTRP